MAVDLSTPVLVVDDYRTVLRIMRNLLAQAGFREVDTAADGAEAIQKMKARKYGLVISDWHMAPVDGLELVRQVKADAELKDTPVILVSGEVSPDRSEIARQAGAAGYVMKPFDAETLRTRIERALAA